MAAPALPSALRMQFDAALRLHQQGRLAQAEAAYRQVAEGAPDYFDAPYWLGALLLGRGDATGSLPWLAQALRIRPDSAEAHVYLGHALNTLQRFDEALASFDRALALRPDLAVALNNRGLALHGLARHEAALAAFEQALALAPRDADVLNNRGVTLHKLGRHEAALQSFAAALALRPAFPEALSNGGKSLAALGRHEEALAAHAQALALRHDFVPALNGKGLALQALRRHDEAIPLYRQALALRPDDHETCNNLGVALLRTRQLDAALVCCERALALKPDHADAHSNHAAVLLALDRHAEALAALQRAVALQPGFVGALINRGNVLQAMGCYPDALATYREALALKPGDPDVLYNDSLARLCAGDFAEGWRRYECRWTRKEAPPRRVLAGRPWLGQEDIAGRRLLLWAEQGMGDSLQFCRYVPILARMGIEVHLEVPQPLKALMRTLDGVAGVTTETETPPEHDYHCPLLSLPLALAARHPGIPANVPYLFAEPQKRDVWRALLASGRAPRIGIVCSGNAIHLNDRNRSIPLRQLAPLLDTDASFHFLQKDCRPDDAAFLAAEPRLHDLRPHLYDFTDTAAAIACLDLVISVDTSVAHLAGALGKPVWILLPHAPDWRWMLDREDSPWYPTARLFRQTTTGGWTSVVKRLSGMALTLPFVCLARETSRSVRLKQCDPLIQHPHLAPQPGVRDIRDDRADDQHHNGQQQQQGRGVSDSD